MLCSVIVILVFSQQLEQRDTACGEQQVCARDDEHDGCEEQHECRDRILYSNSNVIAGAEKDDSEHCQRPFRFGLAFACAVAPNELDWARFVYQPDGVQQHQHEYGSCQN